MSSRGNDALLCCGAACGLLLAGCMLGGDGEGEQSPYEHAFIIVDDPVGAADGLTGIEVKVTGDEGTRLVLEVIGNGTFLNPDPGQPTEKTVFLAEAVPDDGLGHATAAVISTRPGEVAVAFKPDPLLGSQGIRFLPVVFAAGTPKAVRLHPGLVETEICFAVNTAQGVLATNVLVDLEAAPEEATVGDEPASDLGDGEDDWAEAPAPGVQASAQISAEPPAGLDCPAADAAVDEIGWKGYAKMFVRTDLVHAGLSLDYRTAVGSTNLYNREVELFLDPFPGYDVTVTDPVSNADYVEVALHVDYQQLGDLGGAPAGDVDITQRCIPDCPELLGTSAGGVDDPIVTDASGDVTLFFDPLGTGTYVWYLNLSGGIEQRMLPDLTF